MDFNIQDKSLIKVPVAILDERNSQKLIKYFKKIIGETWTYHCKSLQLEYGKITDDVRDLNNFKIKLELDSYSRGEGFITATCTGFPTKDQKTQILIATRSNQFTIPNFGQVNSTEKVDKSLNLVAEVSISPNL